MGQLVLASRLRQRIAESSRF